MNIHELDFLEKWMIKQLNKTYAYGFYTVGLEILREYREETIAREVEQFLKKEKRVRS